MSKDQKTAQAFATSWNNLPEGSVYTFEQFTDWFLPLTEKDIRGKTVLELGCGNGSLLYHLMRWNPKKATGVDLGDSVLSAKNNLARQENKNWEILKGDLTVFQSKGYDLVYSIGVLHHLKNPKEGFVSVVNNTKPKGKFHAWVYAKEGNAVIRYIVDPIRIVASRLPWWFTKYVIATSLVVPYFFYAKMILFFSRVGLNLTFLPLFEYSLWIAKREFSFFRHVAFDQLVTPQTAYIDRKTIESWLSENPMIDPKSTYIIFRNGNSWKFGGTRKG